MKVTELAIAAVLCLPLFSLQTYLFWKNIPNMFG